MQLRQQSEMPLCLFLLGDEKLKRFVGNPAGLPGYTIVHTNNVLLEATKPEQTNQSRGGGVVGSWKQSHQESPPYFFYVNFPTQILILAGWWRSAAEEVQRIALGQPRVPLVEPAVRAGGSIVQSWGTGSREAGTVAAVTNALTPSSCLPCPGHHVSLYTRCWHVLPFLLKTHAYHKAYKCMCNRGKT